ncbi:MAG TPA: methyltransferase domain-containing protein, partial [Candidatus Limnocylindria bacterium]|nr:methyltransferase domain-containing protein [Candidatus Limnocylindria bacterium]
MRTGVVWVLAPVLFALGCGLGVLWSTGREPKTPAKAPPPIAKVADPSRVEQDKALLALIATGRGVNGSAIYNLDIANFYWQLWQDRTTGAGAPAILELGPGENLGQGVLLVAMGAKNYAGLDLHQPPHLEDRHGYQAAMELLGLASPGRAKLRAAEIFSVEGERVVFNPERVQYLYPRQSYDIRLPDGSIDYVFSHSVFEHIAHPAKTVAAIAKVLRHGGLSAHHFDMRDHTDLSKPLEFLKADAAAWAARFDASNAHLYTNRQRLSDFIRQ